MDTIPILAFEGMLIVSFQGDINDTSANQLQQNIGTRLSSTSAKGVLLDISAMDIIDTYIGRVIGTISEISKIMGANTVVVGMQPAVAITLIELGMELKNIVTAINMDQGLKLLKSSVQKTAMHEQLDNEDVEDLGQEYLGITED